MTVRPSSRQADSTSRRIAESVAPADSGRGERLPSRDDEQRLASDAEQHAVAALAHGQFASSPADRPFRIAVAKQRGGGRISFVRSIAPDRAEHHTLVPQYEMRIKQGTVGLDQVFASVGAFVDSFGKQPKRHAGALSRKPLISTVGQIRSAIRLSDRSVCMPYKTVEGAGQDFEVYGKKRSRASERMNALEEVIPFQHRQRIGQLGRLDERSVEADAFHGSRQN